MVQARAAGQPEALSEIGKAHYDTGNDLFSRMLDPWMQYSCGYWQSGANDLDAAQVAKLDLVCRKLELKPGMTLLDVGCGWGGLSKFAAERYGVSVVGITVSEEQADHARAWCEGLPVEIRVQDYRLVQDRFDRIVSVGMFEHVGRTLLSGLFRHAAALPQRRRAGAGPHHRHQFVRVHLPVADPVHLPRGVSAIAW